MSAFQQAMFIIACGASLVLVVQIICMIIGGANDADFSSGGGMTDALDSDISGGGGLTDAFDGDVSTSGGFSSMVDGIGGSGDIPGADGSDVSSDNAGINSGLAFGLRLLSLRSIVAFVAVGGWMGYTLCYMLPWYAALPIALLCGFVAACAMAGAMLGMERMQNSGNLNPINAIGAQGTVYLTIPPKRGGKGKINVLVQERYAEYEAVTDSDEPLPTASEIKVIGHVGNNVLLVTKYKKPSITIENK